MKENENKLEKAVKALKNQPIPSGPPEELADQTIAKLTEASPKANTTTPDRQVGFIERLKVTNSFTKLAAAAVLLIMAGYTTGRLASPKPPDMEQIQAAIEPAIRSRLLDEMKQYLQLGLTNCYVKLQDDLTQQYRTDLNQYAAHTIAASSVVTNKKLEELITSINTAIKQVEFNRQRDSAQLSNALINFAALTEDELLRTKEDMFQLLSYNNPEISLPNELDNSNNDKERKEK